MRHCGKNRLLCGSEFFVVLLLVRIRRAEYPCDMRFSELNIAQFSMLNNKDNAGSCDTECRSSQALGPSAAEWDV